MQCLIKYYEHFQTLISRQPIKIPKYKKWHDFLYFLNEFWISIKLKINSIWILFPRFIENIIKITQRFLMTIRNIILQIIFFLEQKSESIRINFNFVRKFFIPWTEKKKRNVEKYSHLKSLSSVFSHFHIGNDVIPKKKKKKEKEKFRNFSHSSNLSYSYFLRRCSYQVGNVLLRCNIAAGGSRSLLLHSSRYSPETQTLRLCRWRGLHSFRWVIKYTELILHQDTLLALPL